MPPQAIKIDALWKPIIRKFRQCIKIRVMKKLSYDLKEDDSEAQQGYLFGKVLGVPEELLQEERTQLALYMIV